MRHVTLISARVEVERAIRDVSWELPADAAARNGFGKHPQPGGGQ